MELSIAYELYMKPHEVPTKKAMEIVRQAGFQCVDMSIGPFCLHPESPILSSCWEAWADATVQTACKNGITMRQAHCLLFNYMDASQPDHARLTDINLHLLDVCHALGIEYFVLHPGTALGAVSVAESLRGSIEWLKPFVEKAEKLGVRLCMENMFDILVNEQIVCQFGARPDELGELVDRLNSPAVGVCWDTGHAHIARLDQKKSLQMLGDRVWVTHLHDNRGRYANDLHLPPFYGSLDWLSFMEGLAEIGYTGTLNFETEPHTVPLDYMLREFCSIREKGERLLAMLPR